MQYLKLETHIPSPPLFSRWAAGVSAQRAGSQVLLRDEKPQLRSRGSGGGGRSVDYWYCGERRPPCSHHWQTPHYRGSTPRKPGSKSGKQLHQPWPKPQFVIDTVTLWHCSGVCVQERISVSMCVLIVVHPIYLFCQKVDSAQTKTQCHVIPWERKWTTGCIHVQL